MRDRQCARRARRIAASLALPSLLIPSGAARAECTVAQLIANEPACQHPTGDCHITHPHTVETGCTLDFGARDVRWDSVLTASSHMATLRAHSLVLLLHGRIDGVGRAMGAPGAMIVIETTGDFAVIQSGNQRGQIDVSGNGTGGQLMVRAGGSASLGGKLQADALTGAAPGGLIVITAAANIYDSARQPD